MKGLFELVVTVWHWKSKHKALLFFNTFVLTYSMVQSPSWEANLTGLQLVKKFPAFHGTRKFITALTSVHHLSLSWASPIQSNGGVVYLRIVLSPDESSRLWLFLNINVLQGGVVSTSPNPQAGGPPLVGCPRLLIQFIRSYPPYRRPFLYPQPEDAPCCGDREPLT